MGSKEVKNGGYSLVELLVAITILMLIVGPLLYSFVSSARVNAKSKRVLEATTVAQNVMEDIKAGSLTELLNRKIEVDDGTGNITEEDLVTEIEDGKYTFTYEGLAVDKRTYRAEVLLDTHAYSTALGEELNFNDTALAEIYDMDATYDALYSHTNETDQRQAYDFKEDGSAYGKMERYIIADIMKTGTTTVVNITVRYVYNGIEEYAAEDTCIYKTTDSEIALRNLYLFFEPMYTSEIGKTPKENIVINNDAGVPVGIYLVKQENSNTDAVNEQKYCINIDVNENMRTKYLHEGEYQVITTIRTNLTETQRKLMYGGLPSKAIEGSTYLAAELVGLNSLTGGKVEDRLYKVEVSIYDEEGNKLVSMDGTKEK